MANENCTVNRKAEGSVKIWNMIGNWNVTYRAMMPDN